MGVKKGFLLIAAWNDRRWISKIKRWCREGGVGGNILGHILHEEVLSGRFTSQQETHSADLSQALCQQSTCRMGSRPTMNKTSTCYIKLGNNLMLWFCMIDQYWSSQNFPHVRIHRHCFINPNKNNAIIVPGTTAATHAQNCTLETRQ